MKIVVIDDDQDDFFLIRDLLQDIEANKYEALWIPNYADAIAAIHKQDAAAYLIDFRLGERTGLEILSEFKGMTLSRPMILFTGQADRETDLAAMNEGAADFLAKSKLTAEILERSIRYSVRRTDDLAKIKGAKKIQVEKEIAEAANQAKSRFLAHMSHEIRSPLTAILGFTSLAQDAATTPEEREEFLEIISRSGAHLLKIVNDILDLSKVEDGKIEVESKSFHWREVIRDVVKSLEPVANAKGLHLDTKIAMDQNAPEMMLGDSQRFHQILMNIVNNAIKFTGKGSVSVESKFVRNENKIEISISDTGIGIKPSEQKRLFQPFSQADSSVSRKYGGTGLGLDISKKLARALQGDLVLSRSVPNKGSTFVLSLPMNFTSHKAVRPIGVSKPIQQRRLPIGKLKVLLVEDSKDNQLLVSRFLKAEGVEVQCADNGKQGLIEAMTGDFDAVLMDIQMPEMDGYEATRQLRKKGFLKPIIALTAHALAEERAKALSSGFSSFVSKPIAREQLLQALCEMS
jgi:signal transduction histidine kinase